MLKKPTPASKPPRCTICAFMSSITRAPVARVQAAIQSCTTWFRWCGAIGTMFILSRLPYGCSTLAPQLGHP